MNSPLDLARVEYHDRSFVVHRAVVDYRDRSGEQRREIFAGQEPVTATKLAWQRTKSAMLSGAWRSFRITHVQTERQVSELRAATS